VVSIKEYQKLKKTLRGFYKLQKEEEKLLQDLEVEASPLFQEGWHPEYGVALRKVDFFELDHRLPTCRSFLPLAGEAGEESVKVRRRGKGAGLAVVSLALILAGIIVSGNLGNPYYGPGFCRYRQLVYTHERQKQVSKKGWERQARKVPGGRPKSKG
jgi:hypothetical protein